MAKQALQEIGDDDGGEAQRQFIDEQQFGLANEPGGDGQHLPLAPRQQAGRALAQRRQPREKIIDEPLAPALLGAARARGHRHQQVFGHRQVCKHLAALGHQHNAGPGADVGWRVRDRLALKVDATIGDAGIIEAMEARDGAEQRCFAGAVAAENADDLAASNAKRDTLERGDGALVDDLELVDGQKRARKKRARKKRARKERPWDGSGHRRAPPTGRCRNGQSKK